MKFMYFVPSIHNPGGMERVLLLKLNYLADVLHHEVILVTTENEVCQNPFFRISENIVIIRLCINFDHHLNDFLAIKFIKHVYKNSVYRRTVKRLLSIYDPDICVSLLGKEVAFLPKIKHRSITIGEIHFAKNNRKQFLTAKNASFFNNILGDIRTWHLENDVKCFDHLVVLTDQDRLNWNINNISCIPNINPLTVSASNISLRQKNNYKRAIAVGRLVPQKGFDILIDIWYHISKKCPDWELVIIGDGFLKSSLESHIDRLGLSNSIKLLPPTKDIENEYLMSSIYFMTSRYEGLPMVLIEAMACGLPCISFDCECGPREIINDDFNGYIVENTNIDLFVEKAISLMMDCNKRLYFSQNAVQKSNEYKLEVIMEKWLKLFSNTLNKQINK